MDRIEEDMKAANITPEDALDRKWRNSGERERERSGQPNVKISKYFMDCFQTSQQYTRPWRTQVFRLARHFVSTFTVSVHCEIDLNKCEETIMTNISHEETCTHATG